MYDLYSNTRAESVKKLEDILAVFDEIRDESHKDKLPALLYSALSDRELFLYGGIIYCSNAWVHRSLEESLEAAESRLSLGVSSWSLSMRETVRSVILVLIAAFGDVRDLSILEHLGLEQLNDSEGSILRKLELLSLQRWLIPVTRISILKLAQTIPWLPGVDCYDHLCKRLIEAHHLGLMQIRIDEIKDNLCVLQVSV
jgi:hypothetical protein